jgi:hypothetical protein
LAKTLGNIVTPHVVVLSNNIFNQEILSNMVEKIKQTYVLPVFAKCVFDITIFDL